MNIVKGVKSRKIMFLGLRGIGVEGGVETHVDELIKHLPYERSEIEVVGRQPYRHLAAERPVRISWLWSPRSAGLEALAHSCVGVIYAAIKRPKLLHVHAIGPSLVVPFARLFGLRVVATHHGEDYRREKWGSLAKTALRLGEYCAVNWTHACISVSPVVAKRLENDFKKSVEFIPNGVRSFSAPVSSNHLEKYGLKSGKYIVEVARLVPEKRQLDLIAAFKLARIEGYKLVIVGGDGESEYANRVRGLAEETADVVLTGSLKGDELAEIFSNAGLFVLPSTHEGLPIALLEAMSYNLPVLVSDLPVHEALNLPEDSYFSATNVESLASKIVQSVEREAGKVDWSAWLRSYDWKNIAAETVVVYDRVLEGR